MNFWCTCPIGGGGDEGGGGGGQRGETSVNLSVNILQLKKCQLMLMIQTELGKLSTGRKCPSLFRTTSFPNATKNHIEVRVILQQDDVTSTKPRSHDHVQ